MSRYQSIWAPINTRCLICRSELNLDKSVSCSANKQISLIFPTLLKYDVRAYYLEYSVLFSFPYHHDCTGASDLNLIAIFPSSLHWFSVNNLQFCFLSRNLPHGEYSLSLIIPHDHSLIFDALRSYSPIQGP